MGRASEMISGRQRHSFLLYIPDAQKKYEWLSEAGMRADPELLAILNAYTGETGADPSGNGFVKAIVRGRGSSGARQYRILWTVMPSVPVRYAEGDGEWVPKERIVNQALVDAFERKDDDSDSEDDDAPAAAGAASQSQDERADSAPDSALSWDVTQGRPKVSWQRAIRIHAAGHPWTLQALQEYTITRIFTLAMKAPPAAGEAGTPTEAELVQLGKDLYTCDAKALNAAFARQRVLDARDAAEEGEEGAEEDDDEEDALARWRAEREGELRADAEARWAQARQDVAGPLSLLRTQLAALEAVAAAGGVDALADMDPTVLAATNPDAAALVASWQENPAWPKTLSRPRLRSVRIRDFLSTPSRSAIVRGWLQLQRSLHDAATPAQRRSTALGSAYGPSWPSRSTPVNTPADHVTPVRWFDGGTRLLIELGDPAQFPAVVLSTLAENSSKSDSALGCFSVPAERSGGAGQDVYSPTSNRWKQQMLAKMVAQVFLAYPLISNKKRSRGVAAYGTASVGVSWYARAWSDGPFKDLVRAPASDFERRIQLVSAALPKWGVSNPFVWNPSALDGRLEELLQARFEGRDATCMLVNAALSTVASAPGQ